MTPDANRGYSEPHAAEELRQVMRLLGERAGPIAVTRAYKAFAMVARSICDVGHGNFIISCKDQIVGTKVKHEFFRDTEDFAERK